MYKMFPVSWNNELKLFDCFFPLSITEWTDESTRISMCVAFKQKLVIFFFNLGKRVQDPEVCENCREISILAGAVVRLDSKLSFWIKIVAYPL